MPEAVTRAKTRTESNDELRSIAADTRRAAEVLDVLYERANQLSEPVWRTGWTYPIGTIGGFGMGLRAWANKLEDLADEEAPSP